jgi:hypothetical protein
MSSWTAPLPTAQAYRRAGGRRHLNAKRRIDMLTRRLKVVELAKQYGLGPGVRARIARELRVSERSISRDFRVLFGPAGHCPTCGRSLRRVDGGTP